MRKGRILIVGICMMFLIGCFLKQTLIWAETLNKETRQETLTVEEVSQMSEDFSEGVRKTSIDLVKKQIELQQAKEAILDTRKKENTVRFSLLFNIKFPEKHGIPKEIELIMKVPEIQTELLILQQKKVYEALQSKTAGKKAFYEVLLGQYETTFYEERVKESNTVADRIQKQYHKGVGTKEDVEYSNGVRDEYKKALSNAEIRYYRNKEKLGEVIGEDIRFSYNFLEALPDQKLIRSDLEQAIQYALEHDFGLYEARKKQEYAEQRVSEILGIYEGKYSKYITDIKKYLKRQEGKPIDYEEFIQLYNNTLTQIDSPWYGNYVINLIFFKIQIPKEWFKGEYSGTRYLEDQKYALFVALVEREQAQKNTQQIQKTLISSIRDSFEVLKQMQSSLKEAEKNQRQKEQIYQEELKSNQKGLTSFSSLEASKNNLYEQQKTLFEMRVEYAKALEDFNEITAGYIENLLNGTVLEDPNRYESGDSLKPSWYLIPDTAGYRFTFGVNIPSGYEVDSYELCYQDIVIGTKKEVKEQLIHLGLTYENTSLLQLKFYQDDKLGYISYIDGTSYGGELVLTPVKEAVFPFENLEDGMAVGQWSFLSEDGLLGKFEFAINGYYEYEEYVLRYETTEIAKGNKKESIQTLSLYFSNPEALAIDLYQNREKTQTFGLVLTEEQSGNIVYLKDDIIEEKSLFQMMKIEDTQLEVRPDASEFPDQTLLIGTHAIALNAMTDELFELASKSAEESGQTKIYYKSDLTSGIWYDITSAKDVTGIMKGGKVVTNREINALLLVYYTKPSGVTIVFGTPNGTSIYLSDLNSPSDPKNLTECKELDREREIQTQLYKNTSKQDYKTQMKSLDRLLEKIEDPQIEQVTKQLHALEDFIIVLTQQKVEQEALDIVQNIKNEQREKRLLRAYIIMRDRINTEIEKLDLLENADLLQKYNTALTAIESSINELEPSLQEQDSLSNLLSKSKEQMLIFAQRQDYEAALKQVDRIVAGETMWEKTISSQTQKEIQEEILSEVIKTTSDDLTEQVHIGESEEYRRAKADGERKEVLDSIKQKQLSKVEQTLSELDSYYENLLSKTEEPSEKVALYKEKEAFHTRLLLQVKDSDLADELSDQLEQALFLTREETDQIMLSYSSEYQSVISQIQETEKALEELNLKYLDALEEGEIETTVQLKGNVENAEEKLESEKEKLEQIKQAFVDGIYVPDFNISKKEEEILQKKAVEKELEQLSKAEKVKPLSEKEQERYQHLLQEKIELEILYLEQITETEELISELIDQPKFILEEIPEWKEVTTIIEPLQQWISTKADYKKRLDLIDNPTTRLGILEKEQQELLGISQEMKVVSEKAQKERKQFLKTAADCGVKLLKVDQTHLDSMIEKEKEKLVVQKETLLGDISALPKEDIQIVKELIDTLTISQMEEIITLAENFQKEADKWNSEVVLPWNFILEGVTEQPIILSKFPIQINKKILVPAQEMILALGGTFHYSIQNSVLILRGQEKWIELIPNDSQSYFNDRKKTLSIAPIQSADGTIYVPIECFEQIYNLKTTKIGDCWISKKIQ